MSHVVLKGVAIKVEAHLSGLGDEPEAFLHLTSLYSEILKSLKINANV